MIGETASRSADATASAPMSESSPGLPSDVSAELSGESMEGPTTPSAQFAVAGDPGSVAEPREIGGRGGLEPTRYGDWEKNGRCIDF